MLSTHTPSSSRMAALVGKGTFYLRLRGSTKGSLKRVLCEPLETSIYSASTLGHSQRIQERRGDAMGYLIAVILQCDASSIFPKQKWKEDEV